MSSQADTVDLVEVARATRRRWRLVVGGTVAGLAVAAAVVAFVPPRFDGTGSVVVRSDAGGGGSILSRIAGQGGGAIAGIGSALGLGGGGSLETEVQILGSRALTESAIDSLNLQARVLSPRGLSPVELVEELRLPGSFKRRRYTFTRTGSGTYEVEGEGYRAVATPGTPFSIAGGQVTLRAGRPLPPEFRLELRDREDAATWVQERLSVEGAAKGGEVVLVSFAGPDSLTAAAVPNALIAQYLQLRRTTDRGENRHRVEFITAQLDSVEAQLAASERALREFQEASGVLDPQVVGKLQLERAGELRQELGVLDVERGALHQLLDQARAGSISARQLAAYPTFLRSAAINELLKQLSELETERTQLLDRRLESDAEVVALTRSIGNLEGQLLPLASAYVASVDRQRSDVRRQLDTLQAALGAFPAAAQTGVRLQRDVLRLGQIHGALQAQLVEARLAAVAEGGNVRQLDVARPPKRVDFPRPLPVMAAGLGGGLVLGLLAALVAGLVGRWVEDPYVIERATGVPALRLDPAAPLLMSGRPLSSTVLLVAVDPRADTESVARRLVHTALARSTTATILDLTGSGTAGDPATVHAGVNASIERLEQEYGMVVVQLPGLTADATAAALRETRPVLLVAPPERIERASLMHAVQTLRRLDVPCAGIVLSGANGRTLGAGGRFMARSGAN